MFGGHCVSPNFEVGAGKISTILLTKIRVWIIENKRLLIHNYVMESCVRRLKLNLYLL